VNKLPSGPAGPYAFVFWNDDLQDGDVLAQLRDIAEAGFRGVTLSARIGLSRRVGYLTEEYFRIVRLAVDECARLGMAVMLYDEASYPSGSANGAVVAQDPSFAARCLVRTTLDVDGPGQRRWRPSVGRSPDARLLAVVATPLADGRVQMDGARLLPFNGRGIVDLERDLALGEGPWRIHALFDGLSGGTIRGAHDDQDDESASAPPAADLLNPDAVAAFLALTHDAYAKALRAHLGSTVVAMFTDEPNLVGRNARHGAVPYTTGFEEDVAKALERPVDEVLCLLPALWEDGEADFGQAYEQALLKRMHEVYYAPQARWCADRGVALTGHPAEPDDLATTSMLHWPGQDTVWRFVVPGDGSAFTGPESTAAKVAASAARYGTGPAIAEVLGAYGWQLTLDESKWLLDWYLSRGVPVLVLHAFFYSVRGNRAYESEPDLGPFNSWWPHFPALVRYLDRMGRLFEDRVPRAAVAVVGDAVHADPGVAARLLENQIDFFYVDPVRLPDAYVVDGRLVLGDQTYDAVIGLGADVHLPGVAQFDVAQFDDGPDLVPRLREHLAERGRLVSVEPAAPGLRVVTFGGAGDVVYAFFNEGESAIEAHVTLPSLPADAEWFDPFTFERRAARATMGLALDLVLERRQTLVLRSSPDGAAPAVAAPVAGAASVELAGWTATAVRSLDGMPSLKIGLGDWSLTPELAGFSGSFRYTTTVTLDSPAGPATLDLGRVGEAAKVSINGLAIGDLLWAPYRITIPAGVLVPGDNTVDILVSNAAANHYEGAGVPSGLMGPVRLAVSTSTG
jgi:hypothetical protein